MSERAPIQQEHFGTKATSWREVIITSGLPKGKEDILLNAFATIDPDIDSNRGKRILLNNLVQAVEKINPGIFKVDNEMKSGARYGEKVITEGKLSSEDEIVLMAFQELRDKLTK